MASRPTTNASSASRPTHRNGSLEISRTNSTLREGDSESRRGSVRLDALASTSVAAEPESSLPPNEPTWPRGWGAYRCLLGGFFLMFNSWGLVNVSTSHQPQIRSDELISVGLWILCFLLHAAPAARERLRAIQPDWLDAVWCGLDVLNSSGPLRRRWPYPRIACSWHNPECHQLVLTKRCQWKRTLRPRRLRLDLVYARLSWRSRYDLLLRSVFTRYATSRQVVTVTDATS